MGVDEEYGYVLAIYYEYSRFLDYELEQGAQLHVQTLTINTNNIP